MVKEMQPRFYYGYIMVLAGFIIMAVSGAAMSTFAVFLKPLLSEFGWTRGTTSGAYGMFLGLWGIFGIAGGRLSDRFGPRLLLTSSGLLLGSGLFLMSEISTRWELYLVYGVLLAAGMGMGWVALLSIVPRWFAKRRAMMQGIMFSGGGFGMIIWPILTTQLISSYGWRNTYVILGVITAVLIPLAAQLMRRAPGQMKQLPHRSNNEVNRQTTGLSLRQAVHTRQFWLLAALIGSLWFVGTAISAHIVIHAIDLGISATSAATIPAVMGGVGIGGRIMMGSVADRIGYRRTLVISFAVLALSLLWLVAAEELWALYLFAVIFSLSQSGSVLESPWAAQLFGLARLGEVVGGFEAIGAIICVAGPIMAGWLFDVTGSYRLAFLIFAGVAIVGLVSTLFLRLVTAGEWVNDSARS